MVFIRQIMVRRRKSNNMNFEKIKGCEVVFSYRIDKNYRDSIQLRDGKGLLLRIAKHDELYRNPGGC